MLLSVYKVGVFCKLPREFVIASLQCPLHYLYLGMIVGPHVCILREMKLISLSENTYTLKQFTLLQTQTVTEAREQLYVFREAIVAVIVSVCQVCCIATTSIPCTENFCLFQNVVDREEISELSSLSTKESKCVCCILQHRVVNVLRKVRESKLFNCLARLSL